MAKEIKCPYCGEKVDKRYPKCKFCGSTIADFEKDIESGKVTRENNMPGCIKFIIFPFWIVIWTVKMLSKLLYKSGQLIIDYVDKKSENHWDEPTKKKYSIIVAVVLFASLSAIGTISESLSRSPIFNKDVDGCNYECLADKAYNLTLKSKTATQEEKQEIYAQLTEIQQTMAERAEYEQDLADKVSKKYSDNELFPKEMFNY